jgi:hypothetical protein
MDSLEEVPRIFDTEFTNLFFNRDTKKFYLKKETGKVKSVHKLKELAWNQIKPKYKKKDGTETVYVYRYILVPQEGKYIRVKEGDYEKYLSEGNENVLCNQNEPAKS